MESMGLDGYKVIDFTTADAGPICSEYLALLGLSVIRVDFPLNREMTKDEKSSFITDNLNKKSVTLDYRTPEGKALLKKVLEKADVLIENRPFGFMEELGLGYEEIKKCNPRIVWCAIKPYPKGSIWQSAAWDCSTVSAMSGATYLTGYKGCIPTEPGPNLPNVGVCGYAATGILSALYDRENTGRGAYIEAIMQEAIMAQERSCFEKYHLQGSNIRVGNGFPTVPKMAPIDMFHTKGGGPEDWILIACLEEQMVKKLFEAMGRPDMINDPKFDTIDHRDENLEELKKIIAEFAAGYDKFELMELLLGKNRIISSVVFTTNDIVTAHDLRALGTIQRVVDPDLGEMWLPGCAGIFHGIEMNITSPGRPGCANDEIFGTLD